MPNKSILSVDNPRYLKYLASVLNSAIKEAGGKSTVSAAGETLAMMFGYSDFGALFDHGIDPTVSPLWDHLLGQKELRDRHKRYLNVLSSRHRLSESTAKGILDELGPSRIWRPLEDPIAWRESERSVSYSDGLYDFVVGKNWEKSSSHLEFALIRCGPYHHGYSSRRGHDIIHKASDRGDVIKAAELEIREQRALCRTFINPVSNPAFSNFTDGRRRREVAVVGRDGVIGCGEFYPFSWGIPPELIGRIPELLRPHPNAAGYFWYGLCTNHIPMAYYPECFTTLERADSRQISPTVQSLITGVLPLTRKNVFLARHGLLDCDLLNFGFVRRQGASKRKNRIYQEVIIQRIDLYRSGAPVLEPLEGNLQLVFETPEAETEPKTFQFDPRRHRLIEWRRTDNDWPMPPLPG